MRSRRFSSSKWRTVVAKSVSRPAADNCSRSARCSARRSSPRWTLNFASAKCFSNRTWSGMAADINGLKCFHHNVGPRDIHTLRTEYREHGRGAERYRSIPGYPPYIFPPKRELPGLLAGGSSLTRAQAGRHAKVSTRCPQFTRIPRKKSVWGRADHPMKHQSVTPASGSIRVEPLSLGRRSSDARTASPGKSDPVAPGQEPPIPVILKRDSPPPRRIESTTRSGRPVERPLHRTRIHREVVQSTRQEFEGGVPNASS